ncbi:Pre-mRNA-splicing factor of RES complex-domain-containing protein [Phanerochaete sordida]|uniref:Pre-mRNA-splicing factor of RES complex-domain-containing protein n=1 Tax=Phanerochaete sordida TaxID=48140 RepID=A0A9P3GSJ7_9APHY|nr:Pre-mRNA-splicing factor of RES complex-domain-containing protein [Phanerochaete sordida]
MASSMQAYLAAKYMSGPKADAILARTPTGDRPKKKKRKVAPGPAAAGAARIQDDDVPGWGDAPREDPEDDVEAVVAEDRSFKKRQRAEDGAGWATVREPTPPADEQPQVVEEEQPFKGGLLSGAELKKRLAKQAAPKAPLTQEEIAAAQETVYRDATGRKVDLAAERAEAARKKREAEEKEAKKMEWGKGLVQREEAERKKKELEAMRSTTFVRTIDDKTLNEELKQEERWNDPAAAFLTKKKSKGPKRPEYTGPPPPPNRFGIRPGYRWDGVDRSNGFEKKLFQKQNERKRRGAESYEYSVDDM